MSIERKLAAIVFTDIAGFTELSAKDEENAFALIETQRNVLKPIVKGHGGQWLKEIGDGLLLSFPSSIQAVNCAIAIQDIEKDIILMDFKNDNKKYKIIDLYSGELIDEYYSLWDGWNKKYDNGNLYVRSNDHFYSIAPNTKW